MGFKNEPDLSWDLRSATWPGTPGPKFQFSRLLNEYNNICLTGLFENKMRLGLGKHLAQFLAYGKYSLNVCSFLAIPVTSFSELKQHFTSTAGRTSKRNMTIWKNCFFSSAFAPWGTGMLSNSPQCRACRGLMGPRRGPWTR